MTLLNDYIGIGILHRMCSNSYDRKGDMSYILTNFIKLEKKYLIKNNIAKRYFNHLYCYREWQNFIEHISENYVSLEKQINILRKKSSLIKKSFSEDVNKSSVIADKSDAFVPKDKVIVCEETLSLCKKDVLEKYKKSLSRSYLNYRDSAELIFLAEFFLDNEDYLNISKNILNFYSHPNYRITSIYSHFLYKWARSNKKDFLSKKLYLKDAKLNYEHRAVICQALCSSGHLTHEDI